MKFFKKAFTRTSCILAGALVASSLYAQEVDNRANVYVGAASYMFDDERLQDNDLGFLLGGELPIGERWSVGLEYWNETSEVSGSPYEADLDFYRVAYNYHLDKSNDWQPYLSGGVGVFDLDRNTPASTGWKEATLDLGLGVKRYLSDKVLLRGDVKAIFGVEDHTVDYGISLAIGYVFGSRTSPVSAPVRAAAPVAAAPAAPRDSDGDGVVDSADSCRNTPRGTRVDSRGCELDTDRDGVVDSRDNCAATPTNLAVDNNGCPVLRASMMEQTLAVKFDTNQAVVKPQYNTEIREFADFMNTYSNTEAVIEGHTDSSGAAAYNQALSERRATAVMNAIVQAGISASRLSAIGYGETDPIASNDTAAGRTENRRIDAAISVEIQEQQAR